jgi:hypothetical protein
MGCRNLYTGARTGRQPEDDPLLSTLGVRLTSRSGVALP